MIKTIILISLFITPFSYGKILSFKNEEYKIILNIKCSEYDISCNNITFTVNNLIDSTVKELHGKSINTPKSMNFKGYTSKDDKIIYSLLESDGDMWDLNIYIKNNDGSYKDLSEKKIKLEETYTAH